MMLGFVYAFFKACRRLHSGSGWEFLFFINSISVIQNCSLIATLASPIPLEISSGTGRPCFNL
jgi:hypothetical protein